MNVQTLEHALPRTLGVEAPFDLARTAAPVWWARGRWPNVDWRDGALVWVGWESGSVAWRSIRQNQEAVLEVSGTGAAAQDRFWARRVLGVDTPMPVFTSPELASLAAAHAGMKPWAAGSLFEGVVSSVVGQSISVASAAVTERRLYASLNPETAVGGRRFWPPPRAEQLADADVALVRASGVTTKRAEALVEVGRLFADRTIQDIDSGEGGEWDERASAAALLGVSGIGPWTVRSAFLWGLGDPDAHPSGDVALLRAVKQRLPHVATLRDLDRAATDWMPYRGWAARLFWLDLLGFDAGADAFRLPSHQ